MDTNSSKPYRLPHREMIVVRAALLVSLVTFISGMIINNRLVIATALCLFTGCFSLVFFSAWNAKKIPALLNASVLMAAMFVAIIVIFAYMSRHTIPVADLQAFIAVASGVFLATSALIGVFHRRSAK